MDTPETSFDIFFSYARADNQDGGINRLVEAIEEEYTRFFPDKKLHNFFDTQVIENGEDWRNRLYTSLKRSRIMISFLSASYLASPWCRREWQAWCDIERSRGWLSYMLQPIYYINVPDSKERVEDFQKHKETFLQQVTGYMQGYNAAEEERFEENECLSEVISRQTVDLRPWYMDGEDALRHDEVRNRLENLAQSLGKKLSLAAKVEQSPTNIPRYNRQFCGRIYELKNIRQCFAERESGIVPVLYGLGGEGKSTLAFAYAHAFAYDYPGGRRYVACAGMTDLAQCFIKLGEECGLELPPDNAANPETAKAARFGKVWEWLSSRPEGRTLVILDNIDQPELLSQASLVDHIQPVDSVHVLATTRCDKNVIGPAGMPVGVYSLALRDAMGLLESFRPFKEEERPLVRRLAILLGGHALSLELAGAYLRSDPETSWEEYVELMSEDLLSTLEETRSEAAAYVPYAGSRLEQVAHLVTPMLEQLSEKEHQALLLASLLAPEEVVEPWIREALIRLYPEEMRKKGLKDPWKKLHRKLTGLCLWQETSFEGLAHMHRLVREVVRERFLADKPGAGAAAFKDSLNLLHDIGCAAAEKYVEGRGGWKFVHFTAMPPTILGWLAEPLWAGSVLALPVPLYQHFLRWSGRTEEGMALIRAALHTAENLKEKDPREHWISVYRVLEGHLWRAKGDLQAAREHYAQALALLEERAKAHPEDRKILLQRVHCLDYAGAAETAAGHNEAGRERHRQALALLNNLLEAGEASAELKLERTYTLEHLACSLRGGAKEQEEEAAMLFRSALETRMALLEMDPDNLRLQRDYGISLDFVGDSLAKQGKSAEAMDFYVRSLKISEKLYAADPESLIFLRDLSVSQNKVGDMFKEQDEKEKALEMYNRALSFRKDLIHFDKENISFWQDLSNSYYKAAGVLAELEKPDEALAHYKEALLISRNLSSQQPGNPNYAYGQVMDLEKMARLHIEEKRPSEADAALKQGREILQRLLQDAEASASADGFKDLWTKTLGRLEDLQRKADSL